MKFKEQFKHFLGGKAEISKEKHLSVDEKRAIELRADFRIRNQEFKIAFSQLGETEVGDKLVVQKEERDTLFDKANGKQEQIIESREVVIEELIAIKIKAEKMRDVAPNFSAHLFATIVEKKELLGIDIEEDLQNVKNCLGTARNRGLQKKNISDFFADAVVLGVQSRQIEKINLPSKEKIAQTVIEDPDILGKYALILDEKEREDFLSMLAEDKRKAVSIYLDNAMAEIMKHDNVLSEQEKSQKTEIQKRLQNELHNAINPSSNSENFIIKILSQTLSELGNQESKNILIGASNELLGKNGETKIMFYLARIIRSLSELDMFSGGSLAMDFLGQKDLPEKYFKYFFNFLYKEEFLAKNIDQATKWPEGRLNDLLEFLKQNESDWQDEANVINPFKCGVKIFGYQKMFKFAGRPDVSRHDALFAFNKIINLYQVSGLSREQFFDQILNQVYLDGSTYESGLSYNELNEIVNTLHISDSLLTDTMNKTRRYPKIKELQELGEYLNDKKNIFSSWGKLKKFVDLNRLLERAEILDELEELEEEAIKNPKKEKLAKFIKTLAFHPDSKVDMKAVLEYWRDPEEFLSRSDPHTPEEVQNSKKPSNYVEIPNLDLNAKELRDALIDGSLDRIQAFPSMEIIYSVNQGRATEELNFLDEVRRELGSRKDGTSNRQLFNELQRIFREKNIDLMKVLQSEKEDELSLLPGVIKKQIEQQTREAMGMFPNSKIERKQTPTARRYRAKVNLKSDPQGVLAGNDTSCCMPFGSGKNNVYMFNPNCALFTLEEERNDDWRTIAQSVLTLDANIHKSIPEVVELLKKSKENLSKTLPESALEQNEYFLACDNIEVVANSKTKAKLIEEIYSRFFEKYLEYFNTKSADVNINTQKIIIGQGNSDIRFGQNEKNTFAPVAPVGYSDKLGDRVDVIYFQRENSNKINLIEQKVTREKITETDINTKTVRGVQPLTFKDSLAVAYIEGKAYIDIQSLMEYLHNMENGLIAKDINNSAKNRPNMSFKYVDSQGKMRGYVLAYEGKNDNGDGIIYVSDLASDKESKMAGGRLIGRFVENYKREYIDKGKFVPILMQARESTSYEIIMKNVQDIAKKLGIKINVSEIGTQRIEKDVMHELLLTPQKLKKG